jgi:hypothetical protein
MSSSNSRRQFLLQAGTSSLISLPLVWLSAPSCAATNETMRVQLKYQDSPLDGKSCTSCLEFLPGKAEADRGSCKVIPGDDQISPQGYCTLWNSM